MYPEPVNTVYHFGPLEEVMEGPRRPGHFSGVAVVVRRLFDLAQPNRAYFGEKDFQQIAIAPNIYATLCQAVEMSEFEDVESVQLWVMDTLSSFHEVNPLKEGLRFEPEYFEIVNDITLQPIEDWDDAQGVVGCIAVWLDGVRLIDVIRFR